MRLPSMAARACLVLALVGFGLASHPRASQAEDVLTNQDVVKMVGAKLGDEVIVAKIREAPRADFQLSVDDLVGLRNAGVSEQVMHAMLARRPRPSPNQDIIAMTEAGFATSVIMEEISSSAASLDTTPAALTVSEPWRRNYGGTGQGERGARPRARPLVPAGAHRPGGRPCQKTRVWTLPRT